MQDAGTLTSNDGSIFCSKCPFSKPLACDDVSAEGTEKARLTGEDKPNPPKIVPEDEMLNPGLLILSKGILEPGA